jgi:hypothetical protein
MSRVPLRIIYRLLERIFDVEKIYKHIIIGVIVAAIIFGCGFLTARGVYLTDVDSYRNKAVEFERKLREERDRNIEITEYNKRIESELRSSIERVREAESIIGAISDGLSADVGELDGIIEAIRNIRKTIESYYN